VDEDGRTLKINFHWPKVLCKFAVLMFSEPKSGSEHHPVRVATDVAQKR
jgi:hypothetical protein